MKCQQCGLELATGSTFCNGCGSRQIAPKKCSYCENLCAWDALFCPNCGRSLTQTDENGNPIATPKKQEKKKVDGFFILSIVMIICFTAAAVSTIFFAFQVQSQKTTLAGYQKENTALLTELNTAYREIESLTDDVNNANKMLNSANTQLKNIKNFIDCDIAVKIDDIYNAAPGGAVISHNLYASQMRYLQIDYSVIEINGAADSTLYIDIYNPDGKLERNSATSPSGHTMTTSAKAGKLSHGWGLDSQSYFEPGTYRIDFVYENEIICSTTINIRA